MKKLNFLSNLWSLLVGSQKDESSTRLRVDFDSFYSRSACAPRTPSLFEAKSRLASPHLRVCPLKLVAVLAILLTLGNGNVWGVDVNFTYNDLKGQGTSGSGSAFTGATKSDITMGGKGYGNTSYVQIYANGTLTFTPLNGATITKIVLTGTSGTYIRSWNKSSGSISVSGSTATWTGSATSKVTLTNSASAQARITKMDVTYTAGATSHTLSSAVSPSASGSVSLSATSVAEGSTATATATPATHYVFDHWSISGTGSSLSSTTANPTTVTMGTANTTVTATFVAAPKASITLSEAGATTTDASTYYVGDSYTLPSSTEASCGTKVLVGWSTVEVAETNTKPTSNFYEKGETVTLAASQTFYAVFATASGGGGSPTAYTAGDEGTYVLAVYVSDTWYALPAAPTVSSGKISGEEITVSNTGGVDYVTSANASGYEWTIADATNGQTISDGSKYIYHSNGGSSGTNLTYGNGTTFTWTIGSEAKGLTFKGTIGSTVNSRGLLASGTTFGGYALSNEDASGYYRIHVLPISDGTTYSGYTTSCSTVSVTGVEVSPTSKGIVPGETFTITPTVSPDNATDKTVSWSSNATGTATVTSDGEVEGKAAGSATITCTTTDGPFTATCAVTVYGVTLQARDEDNGTIAGGGPGAPSRTGAEITAAADAGNYVFKEWDVVNASVAESGTTPTTISNPTGAVTVTAKYYKPRVIVWKVNNEEYTPASSGGTNGSSSVAYNTAWSDLTLPTDPDVGDYCGQVFVGWTTTDLEEDALDKDVPADATRIAGLNLMTSDNQSGKSTKITAETTTFHAVFADYTTE